MLVDSVTLDDGQGTDPVMVKLPFASVPVKLKVMGARAFFMVPVKAVPVCDIAT
jgi:hypothetical protein